MKKRNREDSGWLCKLTISFSFLAMVCVFGETSRGATVGHWEFEEHSPEEQAAGTPGEIIDSSGNGHHGTALGTTLPSYDIGTTPSSSAIFLNAQGGDTTAPFTDDRIEIPHDSALNIDLSAGTEAYTIEAIIKPNPNTGSIISKWGDVPVWGIRMQTAANGGGAGLYLQGSTFDGDINFTFPDARSTVNMFDDKWHHIAFVVQADPDPTLSSVSIYVDGVFDVTRVFNDLRHPSHPAPFHNESFGGVAPVRIGDNGLHRASDQFDGAIDAVRFSTGALTPSEFLDLSTIDLVIDRTTGELTLGNNTFNDLTILGYSITSDAGALSPAAWTSIAENYDLDSNNGSNTIDPNDNWTELTDPNVRTDLSEFETGPAYDGATLANGESVSLGAAWIKNLSEDDISATVLIDDGTADGAILAVAVSFVPGSNGLDPFAPGDLDFNGAIDTDDFLNEFVPNYLSDTSGLSPAEAYQQGDFNVDGNVNEFDFLYFNELYMAANPGFSALSLPPATVPEPAALLLLAMGSVIVVGSGRTLLRKTYRKNNEMLHRLTVPFMCVVMIGVLGGTSLGVTVGYWDFEENSPGAQTAGTAGEIIDSSGNSHHGTALGTTLPSYVVGATPASTAIFLDNQGGDTEDPFADDRIEIPHDTASNIDLSAGTEAYTIEAIIKPNPNTGSIISKWGDVPVWGVRMQTAANGGGVGLYLQGSTFDGDINFTYPDARSTVNMYDGYWHHVALVVEANPDPTLSSVSIYVDGIFDVTRVFNDLRHPSHPAPFHNESFGGVADVRIGDNGLHRPTDQFDGGIDAVRFSTGALSPSEFLPFDVPGELLVARVNPVTGNITLVNTDVEEITIDFYKITSALDSLDPSGWGSMNSFDPGKWTKLGIETFELSEGALDEQTVIPAGASIDLGIAYDTTENAQDIELGLHIAGVPLDSPKPFVEGSVVYVSPVLGDMNGDGNVNEDDVNPFVLALTDRGAFESQYLNVDPDFNGDVNEDDSFDLGDIADFNLLVSASAQASASAAPEPSTFGLLSLGLVVFAVRRRFGAD